MNDNFIWASKHGGIAIGGALAVTGLFLAAPQTMITWHKVENERKAFGMNYTEVTYVRAGETPPEGFTVTDTVYGSHETKALGTALLFLGSSLVWSFSQALVPEYERLERLNHKIRRSEWELEDVEVSQNTEVARWAIELDAQGDISRMLNPPTPYMEDEPEDEESSAQKAIEPTKFSETYTGFLGWLHSKEIRQATVRDLAQRSFNGKKIPSEQIRRWVDELAGDGLAEWLDEEKREFRLLNT
jgi:hypothetical protein